MVKCPVGTNDQIKANLDFVSKPSHFTFGSNSFSWVYDPLKDRMVFIGEKHNQKLAEESSESELDSIRADKRSLPTPKDELVYFFISFFLDILLESWEGKPCKRQKLNYYPEEFGESEMNLVPCEDSKESSSTDFLKDSDQKRASKEKLLQNSKFKQSSESNISEYLIEEDFETSVQSEENTFAPDEDVHFTLKNGAWYKGRVSRKLMDGDGIYFWEDGSFFQGEFVGGCATGKGRMEFPDLSVYEGSVFKALRHGEGIFCFSDSPVMYSGQWWLGQKCGEGLAVYENPSKSINFYRGYWQKGFKEGFGLRQYPSGSKYLGFWSNGKRNGKGVMLWNNSDIYRGLWKDGLMHGYGEYTWNGFFNKSLSYPAANTYRGYWFEGERNGQGIFEIKNGSLIETTWIKNMKEGPGAVICCNGSVVAGESLFAKDKPALFSDQEDKIGILLREQMFKNSLRKKEKEANLLAYLSSVERAKAISIPIHSSVSSLNLCTHAHKYYLKMKEKKLKETSKSHSDFRMIRVVPDSKTLTHDGLSVSAFTEDDQCRLAKCVMEEEKYLRNSIINKIRHLKACYEHYATLACKKKPTTKYILIRLFLWQMLTDAEMPDNHLSLADTDVLLAEEECLLIENPHDPFERIQFWQFIHILIVLSWHLYGKYLFEELPLCKREKVSDFLRHHENSDCKYVLKNAFEYFIENDIYLQKFHENFDEKNEGENVFKEADLASVEAMYQIYRKIGEPLTARELLNTICYRDHNKDSKEEPVPHTDQDLGQKEKLLTAANVTRMKNLGLPHFPEVKPPEQKSLNLRIEMSCLRNLKAKKVIRCLAKVCPAIISDEFVVNMDYQLIFLEFYKTVIACTEAALKMKIMKSIRNEVLYEHKKRLAEYEEQLKDYEKLKVDTTLSRKKSQQLFSKK